MKTKILLKKLATYFPKRLKESFDHVGHMCGKIPEEVNKILLCLDLDYEILDEVKKVKPDMIITHHPFIFGTPGKVLKHDLRKADLYHEIENLGIVVYSYHTNFDIGKMGMNDALAEAMELERIYIPEKEPMMRIGYLKEPQNIHELCKKITTQLKISYGLLVNAGNSTISKIGIIGGGGSRSWPIAQLEGCDLYISGDAPHYVRRAIIDAKFNYFDMPHEIEHIFMPQMKKILKNLDNSLEIISIDHEIPPTVID